MKNKQLIISIIGLAVVLAAGFLAGDKPPLAQAGSSQNVSGFAWSETIGWISFNSSSDGSGTDYGVKIDPTTGNFSGYAWSENIGWIDLAPTSGFPEPPNYGAKLDLATNQITGWAKAVEGGTSGSGGWDGWIKMSGTNYGVVKNGNKLEGFAWGFDVVGWIQFDLSLALGGGVIISGPLGEAPVATLTANPSTINSGDFSNLTWTTTNSPASCAASGAWSGSKSASGGTESVSPTTNSTYVITCSKTGFSDVSASATITVNPPPQAPNVTLAAAPSTIDSGQSSTLTWTTANNPDSCIASGDWSGSKSASGGTESVSPTTNSTYVITCSNNAGSASASANVTVNQPLPPPTFYFSPDSVSVNGQLLCGQAKTYQSAPIAVVSVNGFSEAVGLSVSLKSGVLPQGITYGLSDDTLTSGEYIRGFKFQITVPATVCTAINNAVFEILGNGGQSSATATVDIGSISPTFREI